jgi:ribonuclease P protein component
MTSIEERATFRKAERISRRKEFLEIYRKGKRLDTRNFTLILSRNNTGGNRLGISIGKKAAKKAVARNRIKRLLREYFRLNKGRLPSSTDVVIIVRKDVSSRSYRDIFAELEGLLKEGGGSS